MLRMSNIEWTYKIKNENVMEIMIMEEIFETAWQEEDKM